jgi:hypothetical protein
MAKKKRTGRLSGAAARMAWAVIAIQDISSSTRNFILCMKNTASLQPKEAEEGLVKAQQQKVYEGRVTNLHVLLSHKAKAFWEMLQAKAEMAIEREVTSAKVLDDAKAAYKAAISDYQAQPVMYQQVQASAQTQQAVAHSAATATAVIIAERAKSTSAALDDAQQAWEQVWRDAEFKLERLFQAVITAASTMRSKGDKVLVPLLPTLLGLPYPEHCEDTVLADEVQKAFSYSQTDEGRSAFQELFCRQAYELWPGRGKRLNRSTWQLEWPEDLMTAASRIYDGWHELVVRQTVLHCVQCYATLYMIYFGMHVAT